MATGNVVEDVEEPLEDVTEDCFIYEGDEVVTEESDNGADDNEATTDGTHECDGGSSSASSSATISVTVVTEFLPLEKAEHCLEPFWISCPIRKVYTERQTPSKGSLLQALETIFIIQRKHDKHDCIPSESSLSSV